MSPSTPGFLFFEGRARVRLRPVRPVLPAPAASNVELDTDTRAFFSLLFGTAGLDVRHYRDRALARRVPACLRALGVRSLAEASSRVIAQPALAKAALGNVLLGVTEFFRDAPVFSFLETTLLPGLVASVAKPRIWSAACSDGQELYSVALLLRRQGGLSSCELLGTDCRADAVERARQGVFPADACGLSRLAWSEPEVRGRWSMPAELRAAIRWKQADVLAAPEPGPWHLLLCRNVAIYLEPAASDALWASLVSVLAPGGFLVVGKADYPSRHLPLQRVVSGVYRKISR